MLRSSRVRFVLLTALATVFAIGPGCAPPAGRSSALRPSEWTTKPWSEIEKLARGTTVSFSMWSGDEQRNRYFRGTVVERFRREWDIELRIVPYTDTAEVVNKLLNEKSAGRESGGSIDVVWINGENFRSAKQGRVLWGPFAQAIPNLRFYPPDAGLRDFGTPVEGMEAPWQRAQFVMAYDTKRTPKAPESIDELTAWIERHPGRFTYIAPPDFTGSAFLRHVLIAFGDGLSAFEAFDEAHYGRASKQALACLKRWKPNLWRRGETYPPNVRELDRMFANQEVDFAMSYGPSFASLRIERGEFPPTARTFVFRTGNIGNYNFLAIPFNASNIPGALAAIQEFTSFRQLLEMARDMGNQFPLDPGRLTPLQRQQIASLPRGPATLPDDVLASHFIPEPDAMYLDRFEADWRKAIASDP